jgi:4-amino-4-deoxy-L-arabinose transferase-like glycosyltransferase
MVGERPAIKATRRASGQVQAEFAVAVALLAASLSCLLFGVKLGYWDRDESEYAGVAHSMSQSGDFLVPRLFGKLYPDKPPLAEWFSAASFRLLGEAEYAGRLPHVVLSAGACVLVFLMGRRAFGRRSGLVAATVLATSLLFLIYGRLFTTDAALLFFTVLAILCLHAVLERRGGIWLVLLGGVSLGLTLLTKGPIGYLSPSLFVAGYTIARGRLRPPEPGRVAAVYAVSGLVGVPWFVAAAVATKGEILKAFLSRENLYRFLHPMEGHGGPIFYYLPILAVGLFPWTGALPLCWKAVRRRDPLEWGLLAWGCGNLAFFSFAATKLPHYLLPSIPAFALLIAGEADRRREWPARALAWGMAITGSLLFLGIVFTGCEWDFVGFENGMIWLFAAVAAVSLVSPLLSGQEQARSFVIASGITAALLLASLVPITLNGARCLPKLGKAAGRARQPQEPIGSFQIDEPALAYYAGSPSASYWDTPEQLVQATRTSPTHSILAWLESASGPSLARNRALSIQILAEGWSLIEPTARGKLELCRITAR